MKHSSIKGQENEVEFEFLPYEFRQIVELLQVKIPYVSAGAKHLFPSNDFYTHSIAKAKYLINRLQIREGYKLLDTTLLKLKTHKYNPTYLEIRNYFEEVSFAKHRKEIQSVLNQLPSTSMNIGEWVNIANRNLSGAGFDFQLKVNNDYVNISFDLLFSTNISDPSINYYMGTIHSVKGETFDAVLVLLKKKGAKGEYYKTMIREKIKPSENEELRIVYVGITRPRKLLWLAVPDVDDQKAWSTKLIE